ncbi:MAG: hypothetical protein ACOC24_04150 [Desulfovibrionales bacterium]
MDLLYNVIDSVLIFFYRLPGEPTVGFYLGTVVLALLATVVGEMSSDLAYLMNRKYFEKQMADMVHMHNLSVKAIACKDKESYKASNLWANEYFGKVFFAQAAMFAVSLWPVPFMLGWMDKRFYGVPAPFPGDFLTSQAVFLLIYIVVRIAFGLNKKRLPLFRRIWESKRRVSSQKERLISWSDIQNERVLWNEEKQNFQEEDKKVPSDNCAS